MKKILSVILFIVFSTGLFSQLEIKILDKETHIGIEDVLVSNSDNTIFSVSDANGIVVLNIENENDSLFFQHHSYENAFINISTILKNNNQVLIFRT